MGLRRASGCFCHMVFEKYREHWVYIYIHVYTLQQTHTASKHPMNSPCARRHSWNSFIQSVPEKKSLERGIHEENWEVTATSKVLLAQSKNPAVVASGFLSADLPMWGPRDLRYMKCHLSKLDFTIQNGELLHNHTGCLMDVWPLWGDSSTMNGQNMSVHIVVQPTLHKSRSSIVDA